MSGVDHLRVSSRAAVRKMSRSKDDCPASTKCHFFRHHTELLLETQKAQCDRVPGGHRLAWRPHFNCRDEKLAEDIPSQISNGSRKTAQDETSVSVAIFSFILQRIANEIASNSLEQNSPATIRIGGHCRNSAPTGCNCKIGHRKMCSHSCDAAALSLANSMAVANSAGSKSENLMRF